MEEAACFRFCVYRFQARRLPKQIQGCIRGQNSPSLLLREIETRKSTNNRYDRLLPILRGPFPGLLFFVTVATSSIDAISVVAQLLS